MAHLDFPIILTEEKFENLVKDVARSIVFARLGHEVIIPNPDGSGSSVLTEEAEKMLKMTRAEVRCGFEDFFKIGDYSQGN